MNDDELRASIEAERERLITFRDRLMGRPVSPRKQSAADIELARMRDEAKRDALIAQDAIKIRYKSYKNELNQAKPFPEVEWREDTDVIRGREDIRAARELFEDFGAMAPDPDAPITDISLSSPESIRARLKAVAPRAELFDPIYDAALVGMAKRVQEDPPVAVYMLELLRSLVSTRGDRALSQRIIGAFCRPYNKRKDTDVIFLESY